MTRYAVSAIFVFSNLVIYRQEKIFLINAKDAEGACLSATLKGEWRMSSDGATHSLYLPWYIRTCFLGDEGEDVAWSIYEEKLKI